MIPRARIGRRGALLLILALAAAVPLLVRAASPANRVTPADGHGANAAEGRRAVVLAVQRDRRLHVFDAVTLAPLGSFRVHNLAAGVQARPDGGMIFIQQADTPDGGGCCALFSLDLATREMCRLITPTGQSIPLTGNGRVFIQRGNAGIEVFDAFTLDRLPTIAAPGVYNFVPSPDRRWLFGINHFRVVTLDVVDALGGRLVRSLPVRLPEGDGSEPHVWVTGAWLDDRLLLYAAGDGKAYLWTVTPGTKDLGPPTLVSAGAPGLTDAGVHDTLAMLVSTGRRSFVYDARAWWFNVGSRPGAAGAGLFALEPRRAKLTARLTSDVEFAQVVAGGVDRLFGVDAGDPSRWGRPVRLLALDAKTGAVLAERTLADDVWVIAAATIPEDRLPHGEAETVACSRPEAPPAPPPPTPMIAPRR